MSDQPPRRFWERLAVVRHQRGKRATDALTPTERSQCAGKRALDEAAAVAEAARLRQSGWPARAYRCDVCGEWHVGRRRR